MKSVVGCVAICLFSVVLGKWRGDTPPPLPSPAAGGASAVLDEWGTRITGYGTLVSENALRTQIRVAVAQLAMFDAVNAVVDGAYHPYASKPASPEGASPQAAAIRAAYIIALHEFPSIQATIDAAYQSSIETVPATPYAIDAGAIVGEATANAVLAMRDADHRNDQDLEGYTQGSGPGVWIPTSPGAAPQAPSLRLVTPFGYDDPARFRPQPPPALDSRTYAADYNEITDVGRATDTSRTAAQSATALFWSPSATAMWTANVRSLAASMDLLTAARFEAIGIAAVTNALLASWDAKYAYAFWRPITAIRAGDTDGNDETQPDPGWTPFLTTPSHPEYPAAHTVVGAGALGFYTVWYGTDQLALAVKGAGGSIRHYSSALEIFAEEGDARVWGGMHWRNSTEVGTAVGSQVGKFTATHLLKPLDDQDAGQRRTR